MTVDATGRRFVLRGPRSTAEITEVGAALRALTVDGVDLVPRYPDGIPTPATSGVVLAPWPNRIREGRYTFDGVEHRLPLNAPGSGNATHGLLRFTPYTAVRSGESSVELEADIVPQTGYPFHVRTTVTYHLDADGITVRHRAENVGAGPAPFALGAHPYLCLSGTSTSDLTLRSTGTTTLECDERHTPVREVPVAGETDLRAGCRIGTTARDHPYRGFRRDDLGRAVHVISSPDGREVHLWQDAQFSWAQIYTTDRYPGHPFAVAIEPMTAPANAFASGVDLATLVPGEAFHAAWGIRFRAADT